MVRLSLDAPKTTTPYPMSCGVVLHLKPYDATIPFAAQWEAQVPEGAIEPRKPGESAAEFHGRIRAYLLKHDRGTQLIRFLINYGARAIESWEGVLDKDGRSELPFSPEAWELFLRSIPGAVQEWQLIIEQLEAESAKQEEEGNDLPSGSSGTTDPEGEKSAQPAETESSPVPAEPQDQPDEDATTGSTSRAA